MTKHFDGVQAVDDFSVKIEQGKITGIIGPNGSGKTTVVNLLTEMLLMDGGAVSVNGVKLNKIRPYEISSYGIARTFQNARLFEQMTVIDKGIIVAKGNSEKLLKDDVVKKVFLGTVAN